MFQMRFHLADHLAHILHTHLPALLGVIKVGTSTGANGALFYAILFSGMAESEIRAGKAVRGIVYFELASGYSIRTFDFSFNSTLTFGTDIGGGGDIGAYNLGGTISNAVKTTVIILSETVQK